MNEDKCLFCGQHYPVGTMPYWVVNVFSDDKTICDDCYRRLKKKGLSSSEENRA